MERRYVAGIAAIGAAAGYIQLARRRQLDWGATGHETTEPLSGDHFVATPASRGNARRSPCTRRRSGLAVDRPARAGTRRLLLLRLPRDLLGCDIHSADRIVSEWQDVVVGDKVNLYPDGPLDVAAVEPGRASFSAAGFAWGSRASVRLHLGLRAGRPAGRGDEIAGAREVRLLEVVGAAPRRTRRRGQFRDDPEDAPRHQGSSGKQRAGDSEMSGTRARIIGGAVLATGIAAVSYPLLFRRRCLTWGATPEEVARELPGDELLADPDILSTRAVTIDAPPSAMWPWLLQMGADAGVPTPTTGSRTCSASGCTARTRCCRSSRT